MDTAGTILREVESTYRREALCFNASIMRKKISEHSLYFFCNCLLIDRSVFVHNRKYRSIQIEEYFRQEEVLVVSDDWR